MSSWESHCDAISALSGKSYVEACIFNVDGVFYTSCGHNYFSELTPDHKKSLIKLHDGQKHGSFVLNYKGATHKFLAVQHTDEFTLLTFSGNLGDLQKPVMVLARTKTAAVLALFNKRDNNVNNCCKIAENLVSQGI